MIFGRDHELSALTAAYERMLAGNGSVLFLTGEAGLGKTTLVHSWWTEGQGMRDEGRGMRDEDKSLIPYPSTLDPYPSSLFLESACSIPIGNVDVGRLEALQPWADIIAQLGTEPIADAPPADKKVDLKKLAKDSASTWALAVPFVGGLAYAAIETSQLVKQQRALREKIDLKKLIHDAAPAWAWAVPFAGDILHAAAETARLAHEQKRAHAPDPAFVAQNQQQVFQQYVNFLTKLAEQTPVVIFLDDLHWADTSSCNLLFYLSRQITDKRILVIGSYREDDALAQHGGKGHPILTIKNEILRYEAGTELALGTLDQDAIVGYMKQVFPSLQTLPSLSSLSRFVTWLHHISGGNALFVTQFIRTLREDGLLTDEGVFTGNYDTIAIPKTALAVIEERTRRLDEPVRDLLRYATAEGEEFTSYVLGKLTEKKPLELLNSLRKAERIDMVQELGSAVAYADQKTMLYRFSHALVHKALYEGLTELERDLLHQLCFTILRAEWDRLGPARQRTLTLATKLLTHAEKCGEWETVAEVALGAAKEAWKGFAEQETLAMTHRVRDACAHVAVDNDHVHILEADAYILQARAHILTSRFDEAREDITKAISIVEQRGDLKRATDAFNILATVNYKHAKYDAAMAAAGRAYETARSIAYPLGEAKALGMRGHVHYSRGAYAEAYAEYQECLAIAEPLADPETIGIAVCGMGNVHESRGENDEALQCFERCLGIFREVGNTVGTGEILNDIGIVHAQKGDYDEALSYYHRTLSIWEGLGNLLGIAHVMVGIGNVCRAKGDYAQSLTSYERALALRSQIGDEHGAALCQGSIASVYWSTGKLPEALQMFERCQLAFESLGDLPSAAITWNNIGLVQLAAGNPDDAGASFRKGLEAFEAMGRRGGIIAVLLNLGLLSASKKEFDEALAHYSRALPLAEEIGDKYKIGMILGNIGAVYRSIGRWNDGLHFLDRAQAINRECGHRQLLGNNLWEVGLIREGLAAGLVGEARRAQLEEAERAASEGWELLSESGSSEAGPCHVSLERIRNALAQIPPL